MSAADRSGPDRPHGAAPHLSLAAAEAALSAIDRAVRTAHGSDGTATVSPAEAPDGPGAEPGGSEQALAALLLLRELRERLAAWEPALIEAARGAGASWAELAHPLGVASRQAAERRYLRVRPGAAGSTGEQRVRATRDRRAADRTVTAWARGNAADLRSLAGQITALTDLPGPARQILARLTGALAYDDAAGLLGPLAATHSHLLPRHPHLAARVETLTGQVDALRRDSDDGRGAAGDPKAP
ncbi:type III effector protein [Streptomyces sp. WMMC1477]|uniref:type III effector protein n=1 Tax=Streptomyces sp. WMMC1477 TaxID=3015155 RepID=UPI0022B65794|nr:type III effector protein [Streptomyces sp. WMMC1477]MCZ7431290.1 type III effector protein [Streptomyces sp. WMMC1477]